MKNLKYIGLALVIIIAFGLLAGCTPQESLPQDDMLREDLSLNFGFSESKSVENDKNYITIAVNGDYLKLEVENQALFDSLTEDEFYIFSYNEDNVLRDIQIDPYLKDVVENSMKQGIDEDIIEEEIRTRSPISLEGLTMLDEYIYDFNEDGYDEKISMYVSAQRDSRGEIMWDDGQRWVLVIHGENKDYVLYDDYVQLGSIQFNVFTDDDGFYITTISPRTASLTVTQYKYIKSEDSFIQTIPYLIDGNVNMLHNSN